MIRLYLIIVHLSADSLVSSTTIQYHDLALLAHSFRQQPALTYMQCAQDPSESHVTGDWEHSAWNVVVPHLTSLLSALSAVLAALPPLDFAPWPSFRTWLAVLIVLQAVQFCLSDDRHHSSFSISKPLHFSSNSSSLSVGPPTVYTIILHTCTSDLDTLLTRRCFDQTTTTYSRAT